jgi:prepilin-type N-terminal cleavage/methylation domain-containing protein
MKNGFTLIEMLLVVVILGILAGLTVPNMYKCYQSLKLKKAVEDMAFLMRYAQSRAIIQNAVYRFHLNGDLSKYWINKKDGPEQKNGNFKMPSRFQRPFSVPEGVIVRSSVHSLDFYPDGTIEKAQINLCVSKDCYGVSTKEQNGYVQIISIK